jgi:hypothetical protein
MSDTKYYFPKARAVLTIPTFGPNSAHDQKTRGLQTVEVPVRIKEVKLEVNSHLLADTLSIQCEGLDCGVDPRFLKNATVQLWMGDVRDEEQLRANPEKYLRFSGIATKVRRVQKEGSGALSIDMDFQDYTTLFLRMKPFPTAGVPTYQDTIKSAWEKVCDNTGWYDTATDKIVSSVSALRDRLVFRGFGVSPMQRTLGEAVTDRVRKWGKPPIKSECNAWDAWQIAVAMLGLISYVDRDEVVVAPSTEHFIQELAPKLVWGENIAEAEESTNTDFSGKGVGLTSFDPITGTVIESFYPPAGDKRIHIKKAAAKRKGFDPKEIKTDEYTMFEYNFCTNQEALDYKAQQVYEERARQEVEGRILTHEMSVLDSDGFDFDLLNLRAGDSISVQVDHSMQGVLKDIEDHSERVRKLMQDQGYTQPIAELIVRNLEGFSELKCIFHVKQATFMLADLKWEVEIHYHNLINTEGDTVQANEVDFGTIPSVTAKEVDFGTVSSKLDKDAEELSKSLDAQLNAPVRPKPPTVYVQEVIFVDDDKKPVR